MGEKKETILMSYPTVLRDRTDFGLRSKTTFPITCMKKKSKRALF